ncbi:MULTISPECIES: DUF397 domain-containing protein [unclassified Saccharopolyspora]|uniref:DUF397 domain-containing protein n=1 Tax=Saccharopolyspora TaxID=1835 RepID=UPI0025DB9092|nr:MULTISPECIES: DUF397 domain-containing protein [unclassified Saccharopolyspora]
MTYTWKKSSRSAPSEQCVETSPAPQGAAIRDSKLGDDSPILALSGRQFIAFTNAVKDDRFRD